MSRYTAIPARPGTRLIPAFALRRAWADGYGWSDLRADALAGIVVGVVALPLSMALAIASGTPPQHGLYTAIVAGGLIPLLGGSHVQVSGPTAAFVVVLSPVAHRFGLGGLLLASCLAGLLLVAMAIGRMGRLIEFVPYPVTTGFTAGIAVVIGLLQVRDLLGLTVASMPEHFTERLTTLVRALPTAHWPDVAVGAITLAVLLLWPRFTRRFPPHLPALITAAATAHLATQLLPGFGVATIDSRFSGIPAAAPPFALPWTMPGPDGRPIGLSLELMRALFPAAFAIAMLGAIESLLSAVIADGMTGKRHDPDAELLGQGVGNLVAPFFGGFAATGAIARTATNVRAGARTPVAAVIHSVVVLLAVLLLAPVLGRLPMAALAALLLLVAFHMSEPRHFLRMLRVSPRGDLAVLLVCFGLTVLFDMVMAVTVGVVLAALLFMKRMADVSGIRLVDRRERVRGLDRPLPPGVLLYVVAGPLFFGAVRSAMNALEEVDKSMRVVLLDMRAVPSLDATALVGLESAFERLHREQVFVILAGVQRRPLRAMARAGWRGRRGRLSIYRSFERAVAEARKAFE
jgi:sulfate permease, SulP family